MRHNDQMRAAGPTIPLTGVLPRAILVIFFLSGAAALIDQIVWTRALYRIFGVTAPAAGTVLVAFVLLGTLGEARSLLLAACGSLAAAVWAWRVAAGEFRVSGFKFQEPETRNLKLETSQSNRRLILAVSFVNGFGALALEVLW